MAQTPSRPNTLGRIALVVCAVWPMTLGVLWLATGRTVPTINVRWGPGTTVEQRSEAERELSLVWHQSQEPGTVRYFVPDASVQGLERIVLHPLVEDTAFVNRRTFALEDPPLARMWAGDRFRTPWPSALFYVSIFGCLISGVILVLRD